jgi:flavin reductase ActVB
MRAPEVRRARRFLEAMSLLASGLCVVTARGDDGSPCGLLVTSVCRYSVEPPSVLVCVQHGQRSYGPLVSCGHFGVHLLRSDQEPVARAFGDSGPAKFDRVGWTWDQDVPALNGVIAYLRWRRRTVFKHADHAIVIGELADVQVTGSDPLCYFRRGMDWRLERTDANLDERGPAPGRTGAHIRRPQPPNVSIARRLKLNTCVGSSGFDRVASNSPVTPS